MNTFPTVKAHDVLYKSLVTDRNTTVTSLAAELGYGRPSISNVLNGNASLSISLAILIERRYGIPARRMLRRQLDEQITAERKKPQ